jgi:hypothetical protein
LPQSPEQLDGWGPQLTDFSKAAAAFLAAFSNTRRDMLLAQGRSRCLVVIPPITIDDVSLRSRPSRCSTTFREKAATAGRICALSLAFAGAVRITKGALLASITKVCFDAKSRNQILPEGKIPNTSW